MSEFKFSCPQCGQHILCDTQWSGREINCPACQQALAVPSLGPPVIEAPAATGPRIAQEPSGQRVKYYPKHNAGFGAATRPKTYLLEAIVATLLCCLPFGIVSIVYAAQVDSKFSAGDYQGAQRASDKAKTWYHVALISGLVVGAIAIFARIAGNS
jgi:ribosomal protein S27E